jgi:hypothetical protein
LTQLWSMDSFLMDLLMPLNLSTLNNPISMGRKSAWK